MFLFLYIFLFELELARTLFFLGIVMVYFKQGSLPRTTKLRRYRACFVSKNNVLLNCTLLYEGKIQPQEMLFY